MLRAGYGEKGRSQSNLIGAPGGYATPQGSVISPILSNIYLDKFDRMIENEAERFKVGQRPVRNKEYHRIATALTRARQKENKVKVVELAKQLKKLPYTDYRSSDFKKRVYCRYADDWIIGVKGSYEETEAILNKCREFLRDELKLVLSEEKTKITNLMKDKVSFLGADFKKSDISRKKVVERYVRNGAVAGTLRAVKIAHSAEQI